MSPLALAFAVLEITGSAAWLSAVTTAALIPMLATMLLGSAIADRHRRDRVLRLTRLGASLTQTGVAVLLLTHQHPGRSRTGIEHDALLRPREIAYLSRGARQLRIVRANSCQTDVRVPTVVR